MKLLVIICLTICTCASVSAEPVLLTFDEVQTQSVNGLTVNGISFDFRINNQPSPDARYNAVGPGDFNFIQGQVLEGTALGALTLNFNVPVTRVDFGAALSSSQDLPSAVMVQFYDPSLNSLDALSLDLLSQDFLSEGHLSYRNSAIGRAVITFSTNFSPIVPNIQRFALDNLGVEPIPEPGTLLLLGTGVAAFAGAIRKRRRQN
jgi:hypothetical protein